MIRIYQIQLVEVEDGSTLNRVEVFCNSSDAKPTEGFCNGSTLTEVDTGKLFLFDEVALEWVQASN